MLTNGIIRNCEKCGASYGQYNEEKENNFTEYWCELGDKSKETKGVCQFCNPKSKFFIDRSSMINNK